MVFRSAFGEGEGQSASLLIDTSLRFPIALDEGGWKKAGIDLSTLKVLPNAGGLRHGLLPHVHMGAFDVPDVPGVHGAQLGEYEKGLDVDLDGMVGAGLVAASR